MKRSIQIALMVIIAIAIHILLAGQVVLFGSLYRFGSRIAEQGTGDLVYMQDKKVVTQKITEYTRITNLQSDLSQATQDIYQSLVAVVPSVTMTGRVLLEAYQLSTNLGVVLTNDGTILFSQPIKIGDTLATQQGYTYKISRVVSVSGTNLSYGIVDIGKQQPLLLSSKSFLSWQSAINLGQFLLATTMDNGRQTLSLCMVTKILEDKVQCESVVGLWNINTLVYDVYGQIVGTTQSVDNKKYVINLITKEQNDNRLQQILSQSGVTKIIPRIYTTVFDHISPVGGNFLGLSKDAGRLVSSRGSGELAEFENYTGMITQIQNKNPVYGRSVQSLLQGVESGVVIEFEK